MSFVSVGVFFVVMFGLGALLAGLVRRDRPTGLDLFIYPGLGLCAFMVLSVVFTMLRVPLDWRIFAALGVGGIVFFLLAHRAALASMFSKPSVQWLFHVAVILLIIGMFIVYHQGAFSYPYLADDDSWGHASSALYISQEKTLLEPQNTYNKLFDVGAFQYIDPYPPGYDAIMGVFTQLDVVSWTLKFFNALIISLGYLFFYAFAIMFLRSRLRAFLATLVLLALPAYFSHFIWAISIAVPVYFVTMYALERMRENRWWGIPAAVSAAAGMLTSPTHAVYFVIFLGVYVLGRMICERRISLYMIGSLFGGAALSFVFWWGPMLVRYGGVGGVLSAIGLRGSDVLSLPGTGDRVYSLSDFLIAQNSNMINAPVGLGLAACILLALGIVLLLRRGSQMFTPQHEWAPITLGWFALMLYAVNAAHFALKFSAFRTWMLLAIPVAILAAVGWEYLMRSRGEVFWVALVGSAAVLLGYNQLADSRNAAAGGALLPSVPVLIAVVAVPLLFTAGWLVYLLLRNFGMAVRRTAIIMFLVVGFLLVLTSFAPKYAVNTALWSPGGTWLSQAEFEGYLTLTKLPPGTHIFSLTYRHTANIIGLDQYTCMWCAPDIAFRNDTGNASVQQIYSWLKQNNYSYVIVDTDYAKLYGVNKTNALLAAMKNSSRFLPYAATSGFAMFKVL